MTELAAPIQRNETPSGLVVKYCPDPRQYWIDEVEVPSVTQVLDILHKPALTWWGMKVGVEGVATLAQKLEETWQIPRQADATWDIDGIIKQLTAHKLTVNHVRDQAASRGSSVHQAFEDYFAHGIEPNPANYPPQEEGYVRGLIKFIEEVPVEPELWGDDPLVELIVGSKRHGYAGRLDLFGYLFKGVVVQTGPRTKRALAPGKGIWDVKTSKSVYQSHKLQLAGYREAVEECGYGRADFEAVILLRENGTYDVVLNDAKPHQFLSVLQAYKALR